MKHKKLNTYKKDEIYPPVLCLDDARAIHRVEAECKNESIVKKPLATMDMRGLFKFKMFESHVYICLACNWKSDKIIKRAF